ncbi:MAG: flagellar M-ring protein FliF C-terminal domain-containing protein, partial [Terriglobales bacterium]
TSPGSPAAAPPVNAAAAPSVMTGIMSALDNQSSKSESATFAVSRSVRHVSQPAGRVRRITAAVLIDDAAESHLEKDGKTTTVRRKRTPEEMTAIEKLARAAIGVDDQRGDLLALENLSFQAPPVEAVSMPGKLDRYRLLVLPWAGALRYLGITLLFVFVYAVVLRPVKRQALHAFRQIPQQLAHAPAGASVGAGGALGGAELPAGSDGSRRALALKKELGDKIKTEPAAASRLVQTWIHEEPAAKRPG